jgi:ATP-dependent exoDNAse (exonuclease V) beta subunit
MPEIELTTEQKRAITTLAGPLFVAAGAGSGKTGVVTRRFVHAIASGYATVDEILTITFTKKAAAEMMERIRDLLRQRDSVDVTEEGKSRMAAAYREIEQARISTIDSFCASLLRANALSAGIDPNFAAIDDSQAALIQEEVFDLCLQDLIRKNGPAAVEFITAYDPNLDGSLFRAVTRAQTTLRSRGQAVTLPNPELADIGAAGRELNKAVRAARAAVARIASPNRLQSSGIARLERLEQALSLTDPVERIKAADTGEVKFKSMGPAQEEFSRLELPRLTLLNALRSHLAVDTLNHFRQLLEQFELRYSQKKHEMGAMDFADLALHTRDLLKGNDAIRRRISSAFRLVMIDEFQDTNPLQLEVIRLVADGNLFVVGDENQAIYGFRDAEVALFQQEKEKARADDCLVELKDNFRSQPQIIRFIDHVFKREDMLLPGYLELNPAAAVAGESEDCRVEILFVDARRKSRKEGLEAVGAADARRAEAQLIVRRLQELERQGYSRGDMAVLLRTANDAEIYRDALDQAGIETHFSVGKGYFAKLELHDVMNIFKLINNPLDDLAMLGVLRSPLVGLGDDALYRLYQPDDGEKGYQPVWPVLQSPARLEHLDGADRQKALAFVSRLEQWRRSAGRKSLRELAEDVINMNDYAARIAAGPGGKQDFANLMKLLDLAADFETAWSNDLADFTSFLERQKIREASEVEAPTEAEGVQAVRVMTMHTAKGLEFPLVVLPNLQAPGRSDPPVLLLDRSSKNRIGLKYRTNGDGGGNAFDFDELWREEVSRNNQESRRLAYVAMTRARNHLILSGAAPADRSPNEENLRSSPFDWLRKIFELEWPRDENLGKADRIEAVAGASVGLHICTDAEKAARPGQRGLKRHAPELPQVDPAIIRPPDAAIHVPPVISPTALDTYAGCPRRYYLDNVLRAGDVFPAQAPVGGDGHGGLSSTQMGVLVHAILEKDLLAIESGMATNELFDQRARDERIEAGLTPQDRGRLLHLIGNFSRSRTATALFGAARSGTLQREVSFSTLVGNTIIQGQMDALYTSGVTAPDGVTVVDYKTGSNAGSTGPDAKGGHGLGPHRLQMAAYALAAGRMQPGPVRVIVIFLGEDEPVEIVQDYEPAQIAGLESELLAVIDSMSGGEFQPLDRFDAHHCMWCSGGPNHAGLCRTA